MFYFVVSLHVVTIIIEFFNLNLLLFDLIDLDKDTAILFSLSSIEKTNLFC
eukprot:GAHX01003369.1.p1 GENE.GAHX01003369.1~~GAHX01003369.1.p1  ORF type:complete len:51 (-),score=5.50 GAHX01003369.1:472-624(-)